MGIRNSKVVVIGKRVDWFGNVSDIHSTPDPLETVFDVTADVAEDWHVAVRDALTTALPGPDGVMAYVCLADKCGPHNPYGDAVTAALGLEPLHTHGAVWILQTNESDDSDLFFSAMPDNITAVIVETAARLRAIPERAPSHV